MSKVIRGSPMSWDISLSSSKLNVLRDCERCFWDANVLKVERPRGIFPSLPGGVDRVMKEYCDQYRQALLPELDGKIKGTFWGTRSEINELRNWRSGLKAQLSLQDKTVSLIGAFDDLILEEDGTFSPYDTKTKGSLPKDDGAQYYQSQCDFYALLLDQNGFKPSGKAYLDYWFPVLHQGSTMTFDHALFELAASPERALALIEKAVLLMGGEQPSTNPDCEYCRFAEKRNGR